MRSPLLVNAAIFLQASATSFSTQLNSPVAPSVFTLFFEDELCQCGANLVHTQLPDVEKK